MPYLFIPEISIKSMIDAILLYIRTDYNGVTDKNDSYLAKLVKGLKLSKCDLFTQAVEIFINRNQGSTKQLQCFLFFNAERSPIPTIHIMLPDENTSSNGIAIDEGFDSYNETDKTTQSTYNRTFDTRIRMVITSENSLEVITIYHILRASLIAIFNDLQFVGFQNPKLSGADLQIKSDLVPENIFFRAINLDFFYDVTVPKLFTEETYGDLIARGVAVSEVEESESSSL